MFRLLVFIGALGTGYFIYQQFLAKQGEFDENGNAKTALYVINNCPPCDDAVRFLKARKIDFELLDALGNGKERAANYRQASYPMLVIGDSVQKGYSRAEFTAELGKSYGLASLPRSDQRVFSYNFDESGSAKVVMYGTKSCGYCKKAKQYFTDAGVDYIEYDIESNGAASRRFKQLDGSGTPLIYIGFDRINGFNERKLNELL